MFNEQQLSNIKEAKGYDSMLVLVKNIQINYNQPFVTSIPNVYDYQSLAQTYLRTAVFNVVQFDFDVEQLPERGVQDIEMTYIMPDNQDYDVNIFDNSSSFEATQYLVTAMTMSSCIVRIDDIVLECADDDLKFATYETLIRTLPIYFMYRPF